MTVPKETVATPMLPSTFMLLLLTALLRKVQKEHLLL